MGLGYTFVACLSIVWFFPYVRTHLFGCRMSLFMGRLMSCCRVSQPTWLWSLCSLGVKKIKTPGSPWLSLAADRVLWCHRCRSLQCAAR